MGTSGTGWGCGCRGQSWAWVWDGTGGSVSPRVRLRVPVTSSAPQPEPQGDVERWMWMYLGDLHCMASPERRGWVGARAGTSTSQGGRSESESASESASELQRHHGSTRPIGSVALRIVRPRRRSSHVDTVADASSLSRRHATQCDAMLICCSGRYADKSELLLGGGGNVNARRAASRRHDSENEQSPVHFSSGQFTPARLGPDDSLVRYDYLPPITTTSLPPCSAGRVVPNRVRRSLPTTSHATGGDFAPVTAGRGVYCTTRTRYQENGQ
jgi:hypothetical protein